MFAVSHNTARDLTAAYGIPPERIRVVYNAYDERRFSPESQARDAAIINHMAGMPYFLRTIQPRKNFDALIRAFVKVKRELQIPHWLVIVAQRHRRRDLMFSPFAHLGTP